MSAWSKREDTYIQSQGNAVVRLYVEEMTIGNCKLAKTTSSLAEEKTSAEKKNKEDARRGKEKVQVFPNPVQGNLHLKADQNILSFRLFNVQGIEVFHSKGTTDADISMLPQGLYFLEILLENNFVYRTKIVKL